MPASLGMTVTELPPVETLATLVRKGPMHQAHLAFGALGVWMEANHFHITGPSRELFLELPFQAPGRDETIMEVQFPVTKVAPGDLSVPENI